MPIWKPCIVWIAACALDALSYDTKPETTLELCISLVRVRPSYSLSAQTADRISIFFQFFRGKERLIQLTEAFAHVRVLIYENFGGYDIAKRQEGRDKVRIAKFLRQMVDEEIATFRALDLFIRVAELGFLRCCRRSGRCRRECGEP